MEGFSLEETFQKWAGLEQSFSGLTDEKIREYYADAYHFYRDERFEDASYAFRLLSFAKPLEPKYWKGLAASLQMMKEYEQAIGCYMTAQILLADEQDAYIYVHLADCYFAAGRISEGLKALEAARLLAGQAKDERVLQHVALMHDMWSNQE